MATAGQGINASTASLVAAQAVVTQARTRLDSARTDGERILQLEKRSLVSRSQGDTARATVADAKAQVTAANANLQSARAQLGPNGADNPAILAAGAKLETAQYELASTVVKASHFGVLTNVTLSPGHFISAGNPGLTFIDANAAWITVDLRENPLQDVQPGDPAHLLFDAIPGTIFEGRVQSTSALAGAFIERWLFFAQAKHRVTLCYQQSHSAACQHRAGGLVPPRTIALALLFGPKRRLGDRGPTVKLHGRHGFTPDFTDTYEKAHAAN